MTSTTTTYELRTNDNPTAMPLGTATISRHRREDTARAAARREARAFARSIHSRGGAWLQRVIVRCEDGQAVEVVEPDAYRSALAREED